MSGYLVGSGYNEYSSRESGALYTSPNCTSAGHIATHQFDGAGAASVAATQSRPDFHGHKQHFLAALRLCEQNRPPGVTNWSNPPAHPLQPPWRATLRRVFESAPGKPIRTGQVS